MKFIFVCFDFNKATIRLQPWRYIHELAMGLNKKGHLITILTDNHRYLPAKETCEFYDIIRIDKISPYRKNEIFYLIKKLSPHRLIWSISPSSIAYFPLLRKIRIPVWGMFNYPYYLWKEILQAQRQVEYKELISYYRNCLIPNQVLATFLNSSVFKGIIVQSQRNYDRLINIGVKQKKLFLVRLGVDIKKWVDNNNKFLNTNSEFTYVYFGAIRKIRGLELLLKAFAKAVRISKLRLLILARGAYRDEIEKISHKCIELDIEQKTKIFGGWLSQEELKQKLSFAHAAVLPFILVPSEMPLSIIEALAMGKPVISTDLDGIPELLEGRGLVIKPGDVNELVNAMVRLSCDKVLYEDLVNNGKKFMSEYPSWEDSINKLNKLLK